MTQTIELNKIDVLDGGYVILHEDGVMGSDVTIANAAKVSYGKRITEMDAGAEKLISFLAREGHTSPFRHAMLSFEVRAPLMIARQWWKYVVGSGFQDPMLAWNESSRRYITERNEYHLPDYFRASPANSKQGSGPPVADLINEKWLNVLAHHQLTGETIYQQMMADGICAEQARLSTGAYGLYVSFQWTCSVQGCAHLINQRTKPDAQQEFQLFAGAVRQLALEKFPIAIRELVK